MRGTTVRNAIALTLLATALAGCVSFGAKAPKQLITLTPDASAPAGALGSGKLDDAIVVLDPQADRKLDAQRVPVQVDEANVAYLKDAVWVERPARQFRHLLAETIRAKGQRLVLEDSDDQAGGKVRLGGRLIEMGYDVRSRSVIVRYDALRQDGGSTTVTSRRFEAEVGDVDPKAAAVAPALNKAANDVARQVADWVG